MTKLLHPRYISKGMKIYTGEGRPLTVVDILLENGVYKITAVVECNGKNTFLDWEYDMHQYGEVAEPLPQLYRTNPLGGNNGK